MSDKTKEEFEAWHSEQVSRLFEHGESTAASVWAGFKSLLEITWKASRANTAPQPIFDEANERQLFEDSMITDSEEAGFGEPDLYRDSGGWYRQPYHQAAWGGWIACAQSRAKAGEDE